MSTPRSPSGNEGEGAILPAEEITDESRAPSFSEVKSSVPAADTFVLESPRKLTAEELVARFDRPVRPPAPQPRQRAASDGGMFVAHYAVMDPARGMETPAPVPSVMFEEHTIPTPETLAEAALSDDQRAFKAQILATSQTFDTDVHFDPPAFGTTKVPFRRRHRSSVVGALVGLVLALLAAVWFRPKPPEPAPPSSVALAQPSAVAAPSSAPRTIEPARVETVTSAPSALAPQDREPASRVARSAPAMVRPSAAPSSTPSAMLPRSPASTPRPRALETIGVPAPSASTPSPAADSTSDPRFQPDFK